MDDAVAQFQQAMTISPNYTEAHTNLGDAFLKKGRVDDAIIQLQEAVELNPGDNKAQNLLAKAQAMATPTPASK
jgi:Flp pilus assembly protein TadD